ncbi:MAG: hypothetical protein LAT76_00865 [Schleiferiaceae bacterium]|nr:hypothetical protein [Schleiferiaceae bacterium]
MKNVNALFLFSVLTLLLFTECKREATLPKISTISPSNITTTTAQGGIYIEDNGHGTIETSGIVWGFTENSTIETNLGIAHNTAHTIGVHLLSLANLESDTSYFVRAFATNEAGITYGRSKEFSTLSSKENTGTIDTLLCHQAMTNAYLIKGFNNPWATTFTVPYTGGDGGAFAQQKIESTGVLGLVAELEPGNFRTGVGNLVFKITGIPQDTGLLQFPISIGGQSCTVTFTVFGAFMENLDCNSAVFTSTLYEEVSVEGVFLEINYRVAIGTIESASFPSFGAVGMVAHLEPDTLYGDGKLKLRLSGRPTSFGKAQFNLSILGNNCVLEIDVLENPYPTGYHRCGGTSSSYTAIIDVVNPVTGRSWMDRNLGASQVNSSSAHDINSAGSWFQWGRFADGHQCRTTSLTTITSMFDRPQNGQFIVNSPTEDWRNPQNDQLWDGITAPNNPCPTGYRIPTEAELTAEINTWSSISFNGANNSVLKIPNSLSRSRFGSISLFTSVWTSTTNGTRAVRLDLISSFSTPPGMRDAPRDWGFSARCIKD